MAMPRVRPQDVELARHIERISGHPFGALKIARITAQVEAMTGYDYWTGEPLPEKWQADG